MFRRKKKEEEAVEPVPATEAASESAPEQAPATEAAISQASGTEAPAAETESESVGAAAGSEAIEAKTAGKRSTSGRGNRVQKIGIVTSDKMQKTVLVRVDRTVLHQKYRRYVKRRSKFMAHDDLGSTTGDRVRIVETRPLSARKRWRVVEIVQKAAK
jgi:small subunit ribosomal protein S17